MPTPLSLGGILESHRASNVWERGRTLSNLLARADRATADALRSGGAPTEPTNFREDALENPQNNKNTRPPPSSYGDDNTLNPRPRRRGRRSSDVDGPLPCPQIRAYCCACSRHGSCSSNKRTTCECRDANRKCTHCLPAKNCCNRHEGETGGNSPRTHGEQNREAAESATVNGNRTVAPPALPEPTAEEEGGPSPHPT